MQTSLDLVLTGYAHPSFAATLGLSKKGATGERVCSGILSRTWSHSELRDIQNCNL